MQYCVAVHHRTGVEIEAFRATAAESTNYHMRKAPWHDIEITGIRLLEQPGGNRSYKRLVRQGAARA